jgi:hypothetical protein
MNLSERQQNFLENEIREQKRQRLDKKSSNVRDCRANEAVEEHNRRLHQDANSTKVCRANESVEEHNRPLVARDFKISSSNLHRKKD